MKTEQQWKSGNRLDSVMNVLLIVMALGMLGAGAFQVDDTPAHLTANANWVG